MTNRKLASVQEIAAVIKHPNADALDIVQVLGWRCVAKLGEFKPGDKCAYFEIDSVLPERPEFEFLRPRAFRVRTAKLRGELSQGLAFPLGGLGIGDLPVGEDITERLGVKKHEPPVVTASGEIAGPFPDGVPKTDEPRLQSEPLFAEWITGKPAVATVKLDGTSCTVLRRNGELIVCSRNYAMRRDVPNLYWEAVLADTQLEAFLPEGFAVQGEIVGPGIQKNPMGLDRKRFFAFNVYDCGSGRYLGAEEAATLCVSCGTARVPVDVVFLSGAPSMSVDEWLAFARGKYENGKPREGVVIRPLAEEAAPNGERLSFKVINNDFLLGGGE